MGVAASCSGSAQPDAGIYSRPPDDQLALLLGRRCLPKAKREFGLSKRESLLKFHSVELKSEKTAQRRLLALSEVCLAQSCPPLVLSAQPTQPKWEEGGQEEAERADRRFFQMLPPSLAVQGLLEGVT